MRVSWPQKLKQAHRGQSLIEFALMLSVLILLLSGVLDLGRVWYIYVALEDAAGEGALYLSIDPYCENAASTDYLGRLCHDPNNAFYRAQRAVSESVVNWSRATFSIQLPDRPLGSSDPYRNAGETVVVEITYPIDLLTPVIPRIVGVNPLYLTVKASQTIISEREEPAPDP